MDALTVVLVVYGAAALTYLLYTVAGLASGRIKYADDIESRRVREPREFGRAGWIVGVPLLLFVGTAPLSVALVIWLAARI